MNHHPIRKRIFFPGGISGKFINPEEISPKQALAAEMQVGEVPQVGRIVEDRNSYLLATHVAGVVHPPRPLASASSLLRTAVRARHRARVVSCSASTNRMENTRPGGRQ